MRGHPAANRCRRPPAGDARRGRRPMSPWPGRNPAHSPRLPALRPGRGRAHDQPGVLRDRLDRGHLRRLPLRRGGGRGLLAQGHRGPVCLQLRDPVRGHHRTEADPGPTTRPVRVLRGGRRRGDSGRSTTSPIRMMPGAGRRPRTCPPAMPPSSSSTRFFAGAASASQGDVWTLMWDGNPRGSRNTRWGCWWRCGGWGGIIPRGTRTSSTSSSPSTT